MKDNVRRIELPNGRTLVEILCCDEWMPGGAFTNTCDHCGADYNSSGQRLASRSQWGEETGETASDILNHDYNTEGPGDY